MNEEFNKLKKSEEDIVFKIMELDDEIQENKEEKEEIIVTLIDKNGQPYDAKLLSTFKEDNHNYVAFLPLASKEKGINLIEIFQYNLTQAEDGTEKMNIDNITSNIDFEKVYKACFP